MICLGADIENRNADGLTPLLYNAGIPQWHGVVVLRELLRWGANPHPHATTDLGEGALHLAMASATREDSHGRSYEMASLQDRLVLLLRAGCDPLLLDGRGHSPSDFALSSPRIWFQWCFAVDVTNVLSIERILELECPCSSQDDTMSGENESAGSDWESCSSGDESEELGVDPLYYCSDLDHAFLGWNGYFPWSVMPICRDCGLPCDMGDIGRRKRDAWEIFRALRTSIAR